MPRKRRCDTVTGQHIENIARRAGMLRIELHQAMGWVKPFSPHYDALLELGQATIRCENILRGLPPDQESRMWNSTPAPSPRSDEPDAERDCLDHADVPAKKEPASC